MTTHISPQAKALELPEVPATEWRDKKRYLWLMGLIAPTALFVMLPIVWAFNQLGWHAAAQVPFWIGPILLYVLLPLLDLRFGPDGQNPPDEVMERLENDKYYRYCTYIFIPFQYVSVVFGALPVHRVGPELAGLRRLAGLAGQDRPGAVGRRARRRRHQHRARDSATRRTRWSAGCRKITLAQTCYGHFYIEHNRGHHVRVATPEDPASARFGETFWEFLPRSVWGSLRSSWELEAQRLRPARQEPVDTGRNDVLNAWAMSVVLFGVADRGLRRRR